MIPTELIALADYMAGEFENKAQAIADPAWFVHLRLWQKPVPLFQADSITLFAEQANALYLDKPYRPRLMRMQAHEDGKIQVQYYIPKDFTAVRGAGANPERLQQFTPDDFELLPGCLLIVTWQQLGSNSYHFKAAIPPDAKCCFTYQGNTQQVNLGFEATPEEFLSYDKGIDMNTGAAKWGAIMGAYRFRKK
ncbi:chromophore lyase CpcT/CpeT [Chroococcidiopsis sp. FACHB-1243]|uniref:chromophore lyase CpcT/CpeT n=1 Tax=Chroococcidiopsis sp. [FACHB-1243] TaxID=2692781 RepID=UPI00178449C9|nr:chromophore lyase CpcT/CpeT [Chroococcidiopsis sp. [FACHB-1243]]MBD2303949.1 chromophore lyase CpcT/CpeT [Chroococcidiopsis sp. [FACHB-1243]]